MAGQYHRLRAAMHEGNPATNANFHVPLPAGRANGAGPPVLNEWDQPLAESCGEAIVNWLLAIRKPQQCVVTTIFGHPPDS